MNERSSFSVSDMILNRLKLRPLLIFDRVLRNHSIARAARELNLTQPAVTKAIRELEQQLDTVLFTRNNRGVTPTDCGELLGERVKSVISELRYLTDELNTFKGGMAGHVVVGTQIAASACLLPRALLLLKARAPKILVTVREGPQEYLFPALANGELDIVVGRLPEPDNTLTARMALNHRALYRDSFGLVAGSNHPLAAKVDINPQDLAEWPWILPPIDSPARRVADHFFQESGVQVPENVVESLSLLTNVNLLVDSFFLGLMPSVAAQRFIAAGLLTQLPLGDLGLPAAVGFSFREDKPLTPASRQLIECLKEAVQEDMEPFSYN